MASELQIKANRLNAQKSTGPKTAEGKAVVAQNALKHGLFAQQNVIQCENKSDFDRFREELLNGLAPVGGVEVILTERIVSLSWWLQRVERMNSEAIDVMIARAETHWLDRKERAEAGLMDLEGERSERVLGWAIIKDLSGSNVLERLLIYEKRIESSLYKVMNELKKLQRIRKKEEAEVNRPAIPKASGFEAATRLEAKRSRCEKQSQIEDATHLLEERDELEKQSQYARPTGEKRAYADVNRHRPKIKVHSS